MNEARSTPEQVAAQVVSMITSAQATCNQDAGKWSRSPAKVGKVLEHVDTMDFRRGLEFLNRQDTELGAAASVIRHHATTDYEKDENGVHRPLLDWDLAETIWQDVKASLRAFRDQEGDMQTVEGGDIASHAAQQLRAARMRGFK